MVGIAASRKTAGLTTLRESRLKTAQFQSVQRCNFPPHLIRKEKPDTFCAGLLRFFPDSPPVLKN
jgi:hypothetical protein